MQPKTLSLPEIFDAKLVPWSQTNAHERFIVAQPQMRQSDMPCAVTLTQHRIRSKRVIVKKGRCYNNVRNIIAEWPEAGLHEIGKYALVCVLDGHIDYQIGHYKVQCGPGHFIFIPPGVPCPEKLPYVDLQKSTSCNIITFLLHPHSLEYWVTHRTAQRNEQKDCGLILNERAVFLLEALMKEVSSGASNSLQIGSGLLPAFFLLLQREIEAGHFQPFRSLAHSGIEVVETPPGDFLTHLESFVRANLRSPLSLETVATEMYYSRAQFVRVVRRETGQSFNEFLSERRLQEAKRLLLNSRWSIVTIASRVGFKSDSHFRTFFKRHTGSTPLEFRRRGAKPQDA